MDEGYLPEIDLAPLIGPTLIMKFQDFRVVQLYRNSFYSFAFPFDLARSAFDTNFIEMLEIA